MQQSAAKPLSASRRMRTYVRQQRKGNEMRPLKFDAMVLLIALFLPGLVAAADALPGPADVLAPRAPEAGRSADRASDFGNGVAPDRLDSYRGGSYTEINNTSLSKGVVQDNTAVNVASGMNSISGGSFANASGLPIVIQNSGSNVLIQNSTIVNVQFQ